MIGFDTIGNAIVIAYDSDPILATDPWLTYSSYFGSWTQSHEIPEEQLRAIHAAKFIWISHGHPDHLDSQSLKQLKDKTMLLPHHVGARISSDMKSQGYDVRIMQDRQWYDLSDHVRVLCISDYNQDAVLLIDINGRLVIDKNDASDRGWESFVRRIVKRYDKSFLLALSSRYGDADMINFLDEDGERIVPLEAPQTLGVSNARRAEAIGAKAFIPFSSMHHYQRADSVWANAYHTSLDDYHVGFDSTRVQDLPAFIRYDCIADTWTEIKPPERVITPRAPEDFGDHWDQTLEVGDIDVAQAYFKSFDHLAKTLDFVNLRVGGKDNFIRLSNRRHDRGVTFEAPRKSLITAIKYQFFDDMLIANFMRTVLHGQWGDKRLYPDFTPFVAKYGDNGLARSDGELKAYFRTYRQRAILDHLKFAIEQRSEAVFRSLLSDQGKIYQATKRAYWYYKGVLR